MTGDPLGRMRLSPEGIIARDEMVFDMCLQADIPILMVLSGGYQQTNAPVIARSITNLINKFNLRQHTRGRRQPINNNNNDGNGIATIASSPSSNGGSIVPGVGTFVDDAKYITANDRKDS
jgi:hypothetical protein